MFNCRSNYAASAPEGKKGPSSCEASAHITIEFVVPAALWSSALSHARDAKRVADGGGGDGRTKRWNFELFQRRK